MLSYQEINQKIFKEYGRLADTRLVLFCSIFLNKLLIHF
jgi:hypothetical protein